MTPEWVSAIAAVVAAVFAIIATIVAVLARSTAQKASDDVVGVEQRVARVTYKLEEFRDNFSQPITTLLHRFSTLRDDLEEMIDGDTTSIKFDLFERQCDGVWSGLRARLRLGVTSRYHGNDVADRLMSSERNPYDAFYEALNDIRVTSDSVSRSWSLRRFDDALAEISAIAIAARDKAAEKIFADL